MTIIYNLEITAEFENDEKKTDIAEKAVLDPKLKSAWERKVEKAFKSYVPDASIVCSNIKVFPDV